MTGDVNLSRKARSLFEDQEAILLLSVASVWEIALKFDKGKIDAPPERVDEAIDGFKIRELPLRRVHVRQASLIPRSEGHKDPFDRLIAAQAVIERVPLVTNDPWFRKSWKGLSVIW